MHRFIPYSTVVLLSAYTAFAFASGYDYSKEDLSGYNLQPNFKVSDEENFARNGHAVYFYADYAYIMRFLTSKPQTLFNQTTATTYIPSTVLPDSFSGIEVGVGKEWTRYIDLQMAYLQQAGENKTSTQNGVAYSTSAKMSGVLADIGYVFNPDDQFQVMAKAGVALTEMYYTFTVAGSSQYPADDTTKVDPLIGLECVFQFTKHVAFRLGTTYIANVQTSNSNGDLNILGGLSYTI